jgi:predicted metalloendopeptidase
VAWHDYRHATAAGNWMDNTEIYADRRPAGGAFSALDLRLTATAAGGLGDKASRRNSPPTRCRIHLAWYDFHYYGTVSIFF